MNKPVIVENIADNGEHSHWSLVDCETSELLWSEAPEEEIQQVKTCNKPAVSGCFVDGDIITDGVHCAKVLDAPTTITTMFVKYLHNGVTDRIEVAGWSLK